ncbi:MAG: nitroreductase family deazaflavin-dependent oxidoreductase [Chloroflexota bacterium]|jgi:deazaflavin-dependent oxidoreductase (nitroreductase family)
MTSSPRTAVPAPRWVTVFNPIAKTLLGAGVPLGYNALLTIRGRKSGVPRTTPIAIIDVDGRRWVWAPFGEVHWVQNLRAAGRATITIRGRTEEVRATELDDSERLAFFRDVLRRVAHDMPLGIQFIKLVDRVDLDDPTTAAEGRPVFELTRVA